LPDNDGYSAVAGMREIIRSMSRRRRRQFYLVGLLMVLGALFEVLTIGAVVPFLALLADPGRIQSLPLVIPVTEALGATTRQDQLFVVAAIFAAAALMAGIFRLILSWSSQTFVFKLGHDLTVQIQRRILSQPYSYHISQNSSEIVASLEKVQILVNYGLLRIMLAMTAVIISIFIIAAIVYIDPLTALLAAIGFGLTYGLVTYFTRERLARNSKIVSSAYSRRVQIIQESLGGIRDIILDGSQAVYVDELEKADRSLVNARASSEFIAATPRFVIEAAGMVLIAVIAVVITAREGGIQQSLPILGALALGAQRLLPLFQQIYYGWASAAANRSVMNDTLKLMALPIPAETQTAVVPLELQHEFKMDDVAFTYPNRTQPALSQISFTITRGMRLAIVGATGSGKSTLVDLIMGLLEPTDGHIKVDGQNLTGTVRRAWQKSIAHVPQSIFLADSTIAENIAFDSKNGVIDMDRVVAAARKAQLHDFIMSLPDGYHSGAGERGIRLSGGQRQRLGIARALYKRAPVLVLDEATSALDIQTEADVMKSLNTLEEDGLTIIIIAHRLSTLSGCDTVIRLENGQVAEIGSYATAIGHRAA
jgi:ABC-type multidrug transport system fused ATPase/permease subunit